MARKVHLHRPGRMSTHCGRNLHFTLGAATGAVVEYASFPSNIDVTVHGTLVTCAKCIEGTSHVG